MTTGESFIDVDFAQRPKQGQFVAGDVFVCRKIKEEGRVVAVLSDGLGSGVKASVLATLTATMAIKYTQAFEDIRKSAATIMETLPVCEVRKISYSTFTIIDLDDDGTCRFIEHGNPPLLLLRGARPVEFQRESFTLEAWKDREIRFGHVKLEIEDRLVCFSDGVTQAGMGKPLLPLGWGQAGVARHVCQALSRDPQLSSHQLAQVLVDEARLHDDQQVKDDITAAVVYFRHPRRLLVLTGPPFNKERDRSMAELTAHFPGRKAIAGGTFELTSLIRTRSSSSCV
jgi:serine phosphatase RsbU (regulator of sigma subunit)